MLKMEILEYAYEGKGLNRVFENAKWMVGIKKLEAGKRHQRFGLCGTS